VEDDDLGADSDPPLEYLDCHEGSMAGAASYQLLAAGRWPLATTAGPRAHPRSS
jgi:hypothetical protein